MTMRKALMVTGLVALVASISGTALGTDPQAMATLKPGGARPHPPSATISGFASGAASNSPLGAIYTGGALAVMVTVDNPAAWPVDNVTVKFNYGTGVLEQVISLPAQSSKQVPFVDPAGFQSTCAPRDYTLSLAGDLAITTPRTGRITPTCTYASRVVDPWDKAVPDRVVEEQSGHAFFTNATIASPPTCTKGVTINGVIANKSKKASPSLLVQARAGNVSKAQSPAAFPLGAGEWQKITVPPYGPPGDPTGKLDVSVVDWTKSLGGWLINQGMTVETTRTCTLAFKLEPVQTRASN